MATQAIEKRAARTLRSALRRMNRGGKHWVQGQLTRRKDGELSFCSVGSIRYGRAQRETQRVALIALAEEISPEKMKVLRIQACEEFRGNAWFARRVESVVTDWNDAPWRRWDQIGSVFESAAKRLES